jgi:hypothetical protein
MWSLILSGTVIVAIAIVLMVIYGFGFMSAPSAFAFSYGTTDYLGIALTIIGLGLIMAGGALKK